MITQENAAELAQTVMVNYIKACRCSSMAEVNDALAILSDACADGLCAAAGTNKAVEQLKQSARAVRERLPAVDWTMINSTQRAFKYFPVR